MGLSLADELKMGAQNKWWVKYERLTANALAIQRKLRNGNLSPGKRGKLEWQLTRLEKVSIPRHLSQQF